MKHETIQQWNNTSWNNTAKKQLDDTKTIR